MSNPRMKVYASVIVCGASMSLTNGAEAVYCQLQSVTYDKMNVLFAPPQL